LRPRWLLLRAQRPRHPWELGLFRVFVAVLLLGVPLGVFFWMVRPNTKWKQNRATALARRVIILPEEGLHDRGRRGLIPFVFSNPPRDHQAKTSPSRSSKS